LGKRCFWHDLERVTYSNNGIVFGNSKVSGARCYMKREDYNEVMAKTDITTSEYISLKDLDLDEVRDIQKFFDGAGVFLVTEFLQDSSTDPVRVNRFHNTLREVRDFRVITYAFRAESAWWRYTYLQKSHYEQYKNSAESWGKLNNLPDKQIAKIMRVYENQCVFRFGNKSGTSGYLSGFVNYDGKFKFDANVSMHDTCWIKESLVEKALNRTLPESKYIALSSLPKDNLAYVMDKLSGKRAFVVSDYTLINSRIDGEDRHECTPNNTGKSGVAIIKGNVCKEAYIERELYEELFSMSSPEEEIDTDLGINGLEVVNGVLYEKGTAIELRHMIALKVVNRGSFGDASWTLTVFVNGTSVILDCNNVKRDALEAAIPKIFKLKEHYNKEK
jgi:hypothetical protein